MTIGFSVLELQSDMLPFSWALLLIDATSLRPLNIDTIYYIHAYIDTTYYILTYLVTKY